jgi:hypothetical protein
MVYPLRLIDKNASAVIHSALGLENARFDNGASIIITEYHAIGADNGARYCHGQIRMISAWCAPNGFIVCHGLSFEVKRAEFNTA